MLIVDAEKVAIQILPTNTTISSALVHQGVMLCLPISPTVGITTEVLDLYHVAHLRNPHLSIQAFVRTVCDLQKVSVLIPLAIVLIMHR
jgi:hypothetical protein